MFSTIIQNIYLVICMQNEDRFSKHEGGLELPTSSHKMSIRKLEDCQSKQKNAIPISSKHIQQHDKKIDDNYKKKPKLESVSMLQHYTFILDLYAQNNAEDAIVNIAKNDNEKDLNIPLHVKSDNTNHCYNLNGCTDFELMFRYFLIEKYTSVKDQLMPTMHLQSSRPNILSKQNYTGTDSKKDEDTERDDTDDSACLLKNKSEISANNINSFEEPNVEIGAIPEYISNCYTKQNPSAIKSHFNLDDNKCAITCQKIALTSFSSTYQNYIKTLGLNFVYTDNLPNNTESINKIPSTSGYEAFDKIPAGLAQSDDISHLFSGINPTTPFNIDCLGCIVEYESDCFNNFLSNSNFKLLCKNINFYNGMYYKTSNCKIYDVSIYSDCKFIKKYLAKPDQLHLSKIQILLPFVNFKCIFQSIYNDIINLLLTNNFCFYRVQSIFLEKMPIHNFNFDYDHYLLKSSLNRIFRTHPKIIRKLFPYLDCYLNYIDHLDSKKKFSLSYKDMYLYICFLQLFDTILRFDWTRFSMDIQEYIDQYNARVNLERKQTYIMSLSQAFNHLHFYYNLTEKISKMIAFLLYPIIDEQCFQRYVNLMVINNVVSIVTIYDLHTGYRTGATNLNGFNHIKYSKLFFTNELRFCLTNEYFKKTLKSDIQNEKIYNIYISNLLFLYDKKNICFMISDKNMTIFDNYEFFQKLNFLIACINYYDNCTLDKNTVAFDILRKKWNAIIDKIISLDIVEKNKVLDIYKRNFLAHGDQLIGLADKLLATMANSWW